MFGITIGSISIYLMYYCIKDRTQKVWIINYFLSNNYSLNHILFRDLLGEFLTWDTLTKTIIRRRIFRSFFGLLYRVRDLDNDRPTFVTWNIKAEAIARSRANKTVPFRKGATWKIVRFKHATFLSFSRPFYQQNFWVQRKVLDLNHRYWGWGRKSTRPVSTHETQHLQCRRRRKLWK